VLLVGFIKKKFVTMHGHVNIKWVHWYLTHRPLTYILPQLLYVFCVLYANKEGVMFAMFLAGYYS
jgi:hypothetical protein